MFAKVLADSNRPIIFIEDRGGNFPHSQPVWDDVDAFFSSCFDYQSIDWLEFESKHGWRPPPWYLRPEIIKRGEQIIFRKSPAPFFVKTLACLFLHPRPDALFVFNQLRQCDFLIVCGIKASIIALLTGRPYMIFPQGTEMRVAIGAEKISAGLKSKIIEWLIVRGFRAASFIGSSLPDGSAEVPQKKYRRFQTLPIERIPLPYISEKRLSKRERYKRLFELLNKFDVHIPNAKFYAFIPSRINFYWKGHDRLLRAIKNYHEQLDIHFMFLGWGDDYLEAMKYVNENGLSDNVTILPLFLSKQRLFKFFKSVDFIIDELNGSGSYGTSLSEAMSVGCPVVTWISDMFDRPGWSPPPIIQAHTEAELGNAMLEISNGDIDLGEQSRKVTEWFSQVHESSAVLRVLDEKILSTILP
jgi:glycosyltransferase involved in cell wall biosynthesis